MVRGRHHERQGAHEVGQDPRQRPPLADEQAGLCEIERLQRAQAAVQGFQVVERRGGAKVVPVDDRDRQPALRRIPRRRDPVEAGTDHQDVETSIHQVAEVALHQPVIVWYWSVIDAIQRYWNARIHDLEMTDAEVGTKAFFDDLDDYRFDKLHYLPKLVDFSSFRGRRLLEVGCGIGTDLVRFARGGARVTGVDLSETAIDLARKNFALNGVAAEELRVANGEQLPYPNELFDVVRDGVIQYTADPAQLIRECHRVLKPGGAAIFMVYNRVSWLNALSKVMKVALEHEDAPVLKKFSIGEFRELLKPFADTQIVPERFPVKSRLHKGWKGVAFNTMFVGTFNALPRSWVRPLGWHLMAFCKKGDRDQGSLIRKFGNYRS